MSLNTQAPSPEHEQMVFCLEFFVQHVCDLAVPLHTPAVAFRLLDFPMVLVHPPTHQIKPDGGGAILSGADGRTIDFHTGKSALFQLDESSLARMLSTTPLQVLLLDLSVPRAPKMAASASVDLSALRREVTAPLVTDQKRGFHRGLFPMRDLMGSLVGHVRLVLRLACMGSSLLPHLRLLPQLNREREEWVAKSAAAAQAAASSPTAVPPLSSHSLRDLPLQFGQLDPPVRDDTATLWRERDQRRAAHREQFEREEKEKEEYERGPVGYAPLQPSPQATHQSQPQQSQPDLSQQQQQQSGSDFPHPHAALHSLESLASQRASMPSVLSPTELDPSSLASHQPALRLGPSLSSATSRIPRHSTLETLNSAIAAELRHHNLEVVDGAPVPSTESAPKRIMESVHSYPFVQPQADCYAPPALFFYRDSREKEEAQAGLLEVEYRRCVAEERARRERESEEQRERYRGVAPPQPHSMQQHYLRQVQSQPHLDSHPVQLSFGDSSSQPDLHLHLQQRDRHGDETIQQFDSPRSPTRSSLRRRSAPSTPLSPRSPRVSSSSSIPPSAPLSPLTPRRLQQRHPTTQQEGTRVGRSPSPHVKRAESERKLSALERRYRDMEAQIAQENRARQRANQSPIAAAPVSAQALIPAGKPPRLSVETRQRKKAAPRPRSAPFADLAAPLAPAALAPGLGLEVDVEDLEGEVAALLQPAPRPHLPAEYGEYRPVPKLRNLPLAAQAALPGAKPYKRAPLVHRQPQHQAQRPRSASSATAAGGKASRKARPPPKAVTSTTPFARAFEEVQHLHDQLDSQRDLQAASSPSRGPSAPASPFSPRSPRTPVSALSPGGGARGRKVQFDLFDRFRSSEDSEAEPRVPEPPSPFSPEIGSEKSRHDWPNSHAHHASSYQRDAWAAAGGLGSMASASASASPKPQRRATLGVEPHEFDELLMSVENKLAARSELLYRARAQAPPEFLSPNQQPQQQHQQYSGSPIAARRAERQRALDAALGLLPAPHPVTESTLAQVALDYLNSGGSGAPSRGQMSEFLLRQQLQSIHALVSQPAEAEAVARQMQQQQQQQHSHPPYGNLSELDRARAAWSSGRPPAPLDPATQAQYQWEENLSLAS